MTEKQIDKMLSKYTRVDRMGNSWTEDTLKVANFALQKYHEDNLVKISKLEDPEERGRLTKLCRQRFNNSRRVLKLRGLWFKKSPE